MTEDSKDTGMFIVHTFLSVVTACGAWFLTIHITRSLWLAFILAVVYGVLNVVILTIGGISYRMVDSW